MNSTELLEAFRDEVADLDVPPLWSDASIFRYMDDAQKTFCRWTDGLEDSRSAATQVTAAAGSAWIELSPLILKVRSVRRADTGADVPVVPIEKLPQTGIRLDNRTGNPQILVSGMEPNALRVWPTPSQDAPLELTVFRLPLRSINGPDQKLEIALQHHEALLVWMKHRAYGKQDADTFDKGRTDLFEAEFAAYCRKAQQEQSRRRNPAGVVSYGGL